MNNIQVGGKLLSWNLKVKYLGLVLDKTLSFKYHVERSRERFFTDRNVLIPLRGKNRKLDIGNKLLLHRSTLRSILTYDFLVRSTASNVSIDALDILQRRILRLITDAP